MHKIRLNNYFPTLCKTYNLKTLNSLLNVHRTKLLKTVRTKMFTNKCLNKLILQAKVSLKFTRSQQGMSQ